MISKSIVQNELSRVVLATEAAKLHRLAQMVSKGAQSLSALQQPSSAQSNPAQPAPAKGTTINRIV